MRRPQPPLPNAYWVHHPRLLAGEYPGSLSNAEAESKLRRLLAAGVDCFVDLTENGELAPYSHILDSLTGGRGRPAEYHRHPIPDVSVPVRTGDMSRILDRIDQAVAAGRTVYVHCWGGTGRTGTVVGCHFVRHGMAGDAALERVLAFWRGMAKATPNRMSPETERQRRYVREWLEASLGGGNGPTGLAAEALRRTLGRVQPAGPQVWRSLNVVPLVAEKTSEPGYLTLGEAMAAGTVRIEEVSEAGSVPNILCANEGSQPVLLLDGEELLGAKQNRIVNLTILVPAETTLTIPVSCVERGRWRATSREFRAGERAMHARARARKTRDVTRSYMSRGDRSTDQGAVWADVRAGLERLDTASATDALGDAYERHAPSLDDCITACPVLPRQVGLVVFQGRRPVGLDLFDAPKTYRRSAMKLLRSYALDALAEAEPTEPSEPFDPADRWVRQFLDAVGVCPLRRYPALGLGDDLRLEGEAVVGAALLHDEAVVHLTAFSA